jgi:hypothetical protein
MSDALPLDESFPGLYAKMKKDKTINMIHLKIVDRMIKVVKADKVDKMNSVLDLLDEMHCCFIVYSLQGESEDALIRMDRIFTITYTPGIARPDEKLVYEMQKGKKLSASAKGSIEIHIYSRDELKRKLNAVSFGAAKARKEELEDQDEEDAGKDWMDD